MKAVYRTALTSRFAVLLTPMEYLAIWLLFGICAAIVASRRGANGCLWFAIGVLLGPIGFALAFTRGTKCPNCASVISTDAKICPRCREPLANGAFGSPTGTKKCPDCAEEVRAEARRCRFCGFEFPPEETQPFENSQVAEQSDSETRWKKDVNPSRVAVIVVALMICVLIWAAYVRFVANR